MLDVEPPAGAQRPVVERREVREVPREEPDGQDPARLQAVGAVAVQRVPHRGRQAEQYEERRDVGDERVLEQVHEQEVVRREVLERRVERGGDEEETRGERGEAPAGGRIAACGAPVEDGGGERRARERAARSRSGTGSCRRESGARGCQRGRSSSATHVPSVSSCSTIITSPATCWSASAEIPYAPWYHG